MIIHWPGLANRPEQLTPGKVDDKMLSLLDLSATTLWMAGIAKPFGMQSRLFLGPNAEPERT